MGTRWNSTKEKVKLTQIFLIFILLIASVLRFYKVDQIPHGLYIDEVSIGYNAYTILTKGVDEYNVSYPLFFRAFGEYKMPVTIYLTSASIAAFGKNDFAVKFPSAFLGVLTVLLTYLVVRKLFKTESVALVSSFLLAITPWHIQFSRGDFEANIALFLYLLGGFLYLLFLGKQKKLFLIFSFLAFLLTIYTYNSYRLIAPVTIIVSSVFLYKSFPKIRKFLLLSLIGVLLLALPMILFSLTANGSQRFSSTSAFSNYSNLPIAKKILVYPTIYVMNYLSYFSPDYLFVTGDGNGRHTVNGMGNLFRWEIIFFLAGLYFLFQKRKQFFSQVIFFVFFLAPTAAALTNPSPHSLRFLLLVFPITVIVSFGLVRLWQQNKLIKAIIICIGLFAFYEFCFYLHIYYVHYPIRSAPDWGGAYKEVISEATSKKHAYSRIVVNDNIGMIKSYTNFYNDKLPYALVNDDWITRELHAKPGEKILYITSSDEKKNRGLQKVPHKLIENIPLESAHDGIFAQFWEL